MSEEGNVALLHQWVELMNDGKLDQMEELIHTDYSGRAGTRQEYIQQLKVEHDIFPDLHHTIEECIADDDKVWIRYTVRGIHTGSKLMGLPATGNQVEIANVCIYQVADGKIIKMIGIADTLSFWQQLGVIPPLDELIEQARLKL